MALIAITRAPAPSVPATKPTFRPDCFIYAQPPANLRLDDAKNPIVGQELEQQATAYSWARPWVNYKQYTAEPLEVPGDQPLVPCKLMRDEWNGVVPDWAKEIEQVAKVGLPIPADFVPNTGSDHEGTFLQQGVQLHDGRVVDTYWEAWTMRRNTGTDAESFPWIVGWCGRAVDCARAPGHYRWNSNGSPRDPLSPWENPFEGLMASGIFMRDTQLTLNDLRRGYCDHILGLTVMRARYCDPARWPAQRTDGSYPDSQVEEGMRLFLPQGYVVPSRLHPVGQCVMRSMILGGPGRGLVVTDQGGSVGVRATPDAEQFWKATTMDYTQLLANIPWRDMLVTIEGSDSNPNPVMA